MYLFFSLSLAVKLLSKVISFSTRSKINSSMSSICLSTVFVSLSISFSSWSEPDAKPLSLILLNSCSTYDRIIDNAGDAYDWSKEKAKDTVEGVKEVISE